MKQKFHKVIVILYNGCRTLTFQSIDLNQNSSTPIIDLSTSIISRSQSPSRFNTPIGVPYPNEMPTTQQSPIRYHYRQCDTLHSKLNHLLVNHNNAYRINRDHSFREESSHNSVLQPRLPTELVKLTASPLYSPI